MWIALIPALAWGSIGLISGKLGGNANQQTLGMTWGAFLRRGVLWNMVRRRNYVRRADILKECRSFLLKMNKIQKFGGFPSCILRRIVLKSQVGFRKIL